MKDTLSTEEATEKPEAEPGSSAPPCSPSVVTCVYCGHEYPEGTPTAKHDLLTAHIRVCDKHPMREAEERIERLRKALAGLIGAETKEELEAMEAAMRVILEKGITLTDESCNVHLPIENLQPTLVLAFHGDNDQLHAIAQDDYDKLRAAGLLFEFYPEAPDTWPI